MAVERKEEFVIDLGKIVQARLDSFYNARKSIRARQESDFQRRIIDEDLSYQQQLDYRKLQLEEEMSKEYPDEDYIDYLKTNISNLKNLVRQRKYRDQYNALLDEMVSGRKGLTDQIQWLEQQLQSNDWSQEIKDQIQESLQSAKQKKMEIDDKIIQDQIDFYQKDKTMASLDKAYTLAQEGLSKATLSNNEDLINQYKLTIQAINKQKAEVGIEDKVNTLVGQLVSTDRPNSSLYKVDSISSYANSASDGIPVTINGKKYASERDFWNQTLGSYIQNDFVDEFVNEEKNKFLSVYKQTGIIPPSVVQKIVSDVSNLKSRPELSQYGMVLDSVVSSVLGELAKTKIDEVKIKYALDSNTSTTQDFQNALNELKSFQTTLGNLYSIQPDILNIETGLAEKKAGLVSSIVSAAGEIQTTTGATAEEAIREAAKGVKESSREELLSKTPEEIAKSSIRTLSSNPADYYKVKTATGYDVYLKSTGEKMSEQDLYLAPNAPKPNVELIEDRTPKTTPSQQTPSVQQLPTTEPLQKSPSSTTAQTAPASTSTVYTGPKSVQLGKEWVRKGNDVYQIIGGQLGPKLSYEEFMSVWKPKGLNLDIIPQYQ